MQLPDKYERAEWEGQASGCSVYDERILRLLALADDNERRIKDAQSEMAAYAEHIAEIKERIERAKAVGHSEYCAINSPSPEHGCTCPMGEVVAALEGTQP